MAAKPVAGPGSFSSALYQTQVGTNPAQAYFLVRVLKEAGAPAADVEALGRELLHVYVEQLAGAPAGQLGSVASAIARGKVRSDVLDPQSVGAWQAAFNKSLDIRWPDAEGPVPYFAAMDRSVKPMVQPGVWAFEAANGTIQFMLSLRVVNKTALPLPVQRPDVVWGGEAGTERGGLAFACNWDRPPLPEGRAKTQEVVLLAPGAVSDALVCEAAPMGAYWREHLLSAIADAQKNGARPLWISHELDSLSRLRHMQAAWGGATGPRTEGWHKRLQVSKQEVGRKWAPAEQPLEPPVAKKWALSPHDGWPAAGKKLQLFAGATVLVLLMFGAGRAMLRAGLSMHAVAITSVLVGCGLFAAVMATMDGGGRGYDSHFYLGLVLFSGAVGPMLLSLWALHAIQRRLDAEGITWWQTFYLGWRRALDVTSTTSQAEFWGFFVHCVWWWVLARGCFAPLDRWVGAVLLVPFITLIVRRLMSLTRAEVIGMAITLVCLVLLAVA
ncbi:MAG: hypothetical protein V4627_16625 [Pseudomonadota bacterium]